MKKGTIQSLRILHLAMLLGIVLFAAIAFYLKYTGSFSSSFAEHDHVLQLVAIAVCFAAVFAGSSMFKKKAAELRDSLQSVPEKATAFRTVCIIQWALLEVAAFFGVICFMLVGNLSFLALAAAIVLWFALLYPSKMKTMILLRLNEEEMASF